MKYAVVFLEEDVGRFPAQEVIHTRVTRLGADERLQGDVLRLLHQRDEVASRIVRSLRTSKHPRHRTDQTIGYGYCEP